MEAKYGKAQLSLTVLMKLNNITPSHLPPPHTHAYTHTDIPKKHSHYPTHPPKIVSTNAMRVSPFVYLM